MSDEPRAIKADSVETPPKSLADQEAELEKDIDVMHSLTRNCNSDGAYRIYSARLDEFWSQLRAVQAARKAETEPIRKIRREE